MNTSNLSVIEPENQKTHKIVAWCLLGGLLFLRIPFLMGLRIFARSEWIETIFQIGTYLLTACLIYFERKRLADFHIDKLGLIIIILIKPIQTIILSIWKYDSQLTFPNYPSLLIWLIAIFLAIALWRDRKALPKFTYASLGWLGMGVAVGLGMTLLLIYPGSLTIEKSIIPNQFNAASGYRNPFVFMVYQLGYAAISEEPLFRGFLWGYLQKSKWKNVWIWLFQAGLFTFAHLYYFKTSPFSFWVVVPVGALTQGAIAWRSKTITSSMAAHAVGNALGFVSWVFLAKLLLN